jgi:hypothetical protein
MEINKQKLFEMLLIALLSAGIAFLQNVLATLINTPQVAIPVADAGTIGAVLGSLRMIKYV